MYWGCSMATISQNLEALQTAKANIKMAIEKKGQDLTNVPFTQYGEKIEEIQTGGGSSQPVLQSKSVQPIEEAQRITADEDFDGLDTVEVGAIPSNYVGSQVSRQDITTYEISVEDRTIPAETFLIGDQIIKGVVLDKKTVIPSKEKQTVKSDADGIEEVLVEAIPDEYIIPDGTLIVDENGSYDVTDKKSVEVNVPSKEFNLGIKVATENGKYKASDDGLDGYSEFEVNVAGSGGGTNGLQWVCDNMKTLKSMFVGYTGESLDEPLSRLDTSQVKDFSYCFSNCENLKAIPQLNTSGAEDISYIYNNCKALDGTLTIDMSNVTNGSYAFRYAAPDKIKFVNMNKNAQFTNGAYMFNYAGYGVGKSPIIEGLDLTYVTSMNYFIDHSTVKGEFIHPETSKCTTFSNAFAYAKFTTISLDLFSASTVTDMFKGCSLLENLTLKNIQKTLTIGSGTSYGHLLTVDSLINIIQELWDNSSGSSTKKLSMGTKNLEKIANVYVKLIDVTDEMTAEDQYVANKKPCVVCESTDEGAMTLTEYATSKNWQLA